MVTRFQELIPLSFSSYMTEDSYLNFTPAKLYSLVDSTTISMRTTFDSVAPLKMKVISRNRLAPWYNSQLGVLKQTTRKLERQ